MQPVPSHYVPRELSFTTEHPLRPSPIENGVILGGNGPLVAPLPHGSGKKRTLFKPSKIAWVGNLPEHTNDREIRKFFESHCVVKFGSDEEVDRFISVFDGVEFAGQKLVCRIRQIGQTQFSPQPSATDMSRCKDRYFIVKSLSDEDLQTSVRLGYWATQFKNEAVLNRAFENSDNVYLIFSANKSGQFFGYARMEAPIEASTEVPEITWASVDSCGGAAATRGKWGRPFQI
ncbi:hypothetical protein HK405_011505, partial [Cladochytrium tenue]